MRGARLLPSEVWTESHAPLHPSTSPDAIFRGWCRECRERVKAFPDSTVEELSRALALPVWCVRRVLAAIEGRTERRDVA